MNLEALKEIINNNHELLEASARDNSADENTVVGIARFASTNGYDKLSSNQKFHFDNCIRPLIEDVQCSGYNHECDEFISECPAILDDEDLVEYYQEQGKYCESCEGQASADAHSKESFFRD